MLGNQYLRGAQLQNANLRGSDLRDANLQEANLEGADLSGAVIDDTNFYGADLKGARFNECEISSANFSHADLREVSFRSANLTSVCFDRASATDCDFSGAGVDISSSHMADFRRSNFEGVSLLTLVTYHCDVRGVDFSKCDTVRIWTQAHDDGAYVYPPESFFSEHAVAGPYFDSETRWPFAFPKRPYQLFEVLLYGIGSGLVSSFLLSELGIGSISLLFACVLFVILIGAWHVVEVFRTNDQIENRPEVVFGLGRHLVSKELFGSIFQTSASRELRFPAQLREHAYCGAQRVRESDIS